MKFHAEILFLSKVQHKNAFPNWYKFLVLITGQFMADPGASQESQFFCFDHFFKSTAALVMGTPRGWCPLLKGNAGSATELVHPNPKYIRYWRITTYFFSFSHLLILKECCRIVKVRSHWVSNSQTQMQNSSCKLGIKPIYYCPFKLSN